MTTYERIEKVIKYVEGHHLEQPGLSELAEVAGLSEFHFHRLFSKWAGTTPKDFLKFVTNEHAKRLLKVSDVLGASLESGLSGPGRLHDLLVTVEGVTPGEYKSGGRGLEIRCGLADTPFGAALVGVTARGICHLAFGGGVGELRKDWPNAAIIEDRKAAEKAAQAAFGGGKVSVLLNGTPFQLKVWEALLKIPQGSASTYGKIAAAIGNPSAARAVGGAVGANPVAFLIPCHRVIREAGVLGGYRWGPARKRALLAWESARATA